MQMWFLTNHFPKKNESVQYNTALAITGAIKGSSREKLYEELAQEYLYRSRWTRRLCLLYKVFSSGQPSYIYDLLPPLRSSRRHVNSFNLVACKSEYFKKSFSFLMSFMNGINYILTFAIPLLMTYFAIYY